MARVVALMVFCAILATPITASATSASHGTAVVLLDKSGSMKKTDPQCIRWEAVELLLELMQNQDRAALLAFGTDVVELSEGTVNLTEAERQRITGLQNHCVARDAYTDILAALNAAETVVSNLGEAARNAYPPSVIILTDGVDDVPNPADDRDAEIEDTLHSLAMLGTRVFAVGLSGGADRELLLLMKDITGGEVVFVNDPRDLLGGFFRLSRELGNRWLLWEGSVTGRSHSVTTPPWVEEITAVFIPNKPGISGLLAVSGASASVVSEHYQVIKLSRDDRPQVVFDLPDRAGRLIVDGAGDLVLDALVPERVPQGVPFQVTLEVHAGRDQSLGPASFLEQQAAGITLTDANGRAEAIFLYDDGMHEDGGAGDGVFGGRMVVRMVDAVEYVAEVKAPFSRVMRTEGQMEVVGEPSQVEASGILDGVMGGWGKPMEWSVENTTDVPLPARVEFRNGEEVVQKEQLIVPPNDAVAVRHSFDSGMISPTSAGIDIYLAEETEPVLSHERKIWPMLWFPLALLALLLFLAATLLLPRRSARGVLLNIYYFEDEEADPIGKTVQLTGNGPVIGVDIPTPFGDPGTFVGRSGMWRKGIAFTPAPGILPKFHGRRPTRAGASYIIDRTATWTSNRGDESAKYTLRTNRS